MPLLGELAALLTAVLWSGTSIVFTSATMRVGAMQVNIARLVMALLLLAATIAVLGLSLEMSSSQMLNLAISGLVGLSFGDTFLFFAFRDIGARISMLIMALAPPMSAVLAFFFLGETLTPWGIGGIGLTVAGIALVVLARESAGMQNPGVRRARGVLYAFLGALGQAVGLIFAKLAFNEGDIHSLSATFIRIAASLLLLFPLVLLTRGYQNPLRVFAADKRALLQTAVGSIIGPYLGITFSLLAITHTNVGVAAAIMATPPIIMLPMVRMVYKEKLTLRAVAGAVVAVAGVAILFLR